MKPITIDLFETLRLIESCFSGQTGVCIGFLKKVIDHFPEMSQDERMAVWNVVSRLGAAHTEMAAKLRNRFYPAVFYVKTKGGEAFACYAHEGKFYKDSEWFVAPEEIEEVERISIG